MSTKPAAQNIITAIVLVFLYIINPFSNNTIPITGCDIRFETSLSTIPVNPAKDEANTIIDKTIEHENITLSKLDICLYLSTIRNLDSTFQLSF